MFFSEAVILRVSMPLIGKSSVRDKCLLCMYGLHTSFLKDSEGKTRTRKVQSRHDKTDTSAPHFKQNLIKVVSAMITLVYMVTEKVDAADLWATGT